jgi:hypothetical protein
MEKPLHLLLGTCWRWGCAVFAPADHVGKRIACPNCSNPVLVENFTPFGAATWDACSDPKLLYTCLHELGLRLSKRKLHLLACALARVALDWRKEYGFRLTIETGEAIADGQPPPLPLDLVRRPLQPERWIGGVDTRYGIALRCIDLPSSEWSLFEKDDGISRDAILDIFRDQVPNPFVPLEWNAEWFTSTVRDLASHIYTEREFDLMPVLGDALMDAGCDHGLIQDHCLANKPHARGCWVVDAILGKA